MTLTVDDLPVAMRTALGDGAQAALDAVYQAIGQRITPSDGPVTETFHPKGPLLMLSQEADIVTDVTENRTELDETDYELRASGQTVRRLSTGTHPAWRWWGQVDVTYLPKDTDALRDSVALKLLQLDINTQHGLTQRTIGNYSESFEGGSAAYSEAREAILSTLREPAYIL